MPVDVDKFLEEIGVGRFSIKMYVLAALYEFPLSWMWLSSSWVAAVPPHHCQLSGPDGSTTAKDRLAFFIPNTTDPTTGAVGPAECERYTDPGGTNETETCADGWDYDADYGLTAVNEWDLVCDDAWLAPLASALFFGGVLVGCLTIPTLGDIFGRKRTMLTCYGLAIPFGVGSAFAGSYAAFLAVRFIVALLYAGGFMCQYILFCEYFPASARAVASQTLYIFWALGIMSLGGIAYAVRDWSNLILAISIPAIPIVLSYYWLLPESIHWLLAKGRVQEAQDILNAAARQSNVVLSRTLQEEIDEQNAQGHQKDEEKQRKYTLLDVVRTGPFNIQAGLMCFVWLVNSLVYYGLSLDTASLEGDRYVNFMYTGLVEIPAYIVCAIAIRYGRRIPTFVFHLIAGIPLLILLAVPNRSGSECTDDLPEGDERCTDLSGVRTALSMIGKFGVTSSFSCIYLHTTELYPTVVRNAGLGISSTFARVGGTIAPYINFLAKGNALVQPIVYGLMAIIAGIIIMFLPETKSRVMPDYLEQVSGAWYGNDLQVCDAEKRRDASEMNAVSS